MSIDTSDVNNSELERERDRLAHVQSVHGAYLQRVRNLAESLAAEAAEASEEGIRDIVDEDAEADTAVRAALVRQTSARAMHGFRRAAELESMGQALTFGHTTNDDGEITAVGRLTVLDEDDVLLIDWRAPAAMPFYRSTPLERLDVERRRHLHYEGDEIVDYSDEVFRIGSIGDTAHLRGEAAILAAVNAPTQAQMRSVVATIQSEQDAVVRAPSNGTLVVQGAPGTGKTVVALHRAAYLLYDQRDTLSESGVLIVGPSSEFLTYIAGVLPSLGETGVVSVTSEKLYPGILLGLNESAKVATIKGRADMAPLLAAAITNRQRAPQADLAVWYGANRVRLSHEQLSDLFSRACRESNHNAGANAFRRGVIEALSAAVHDPSFSNLDDARDSFRADPLVEECLLRHWPPLTPEQALNDLLGSKALLRLALRTAGTRITTLTESDVVALQRDRVSERDLDQMRWANADVPLLDELLYLVGGPLGGQTEEERARERDEIDEFELALLDDGEDDGEQPRSSGADYAQSVLDDSEARAQDHPDFLDNPGVLRLDDPEFDQFGRREGGYWA